MDPISIAVATVTLFCDSLVGNAGKRAGDAAANAASSLVQKFRSLFSTKPQVQAAAEGVEATPHDDGSKAQLRDAIDSAIVADPVFLGRLRELTGHDRGITNKVQFSGDVGKTVIAGTIRDVTL